ERAAEDDPDLDRLLGFGSEAVVRRHLDRALVREGPTLWRRLARSHPELTFEQLSGRAFTSSEPFFRFILDAVLQVWNKTRPDLALRIYRERLAAGLASATIPSAL